MTTSSPAPQAPTPQTPPPADDSFAELVRTLVTALIIAMVIRTFAFEPFNIPSSSMVPSLLIGDYLFVSKFSYGYGNAGTFWGLLPMQGRILSTAPHRGDVVVFKTPHDNRTDYIKRLIGLPGDTIQMRQGMLYINGVPVDRDKLAEPLGGEHFPSTDGVTDYIEHLPDGASHVDHIIRKMGENMPLDNTDIFVVPEHHYFFMGDNRDNSQDSRTKNVGFVPEENLVGKAEFLFFSLDAGAEFWEFWKWPTAIRWNRLYNRVK